MSDTPATVSYAEHRRALEQAIGRKKKLNDQAARIADLEAALAEKDDMIATLSEGFEALEAEHEQATAALESKDAEWQAKLDGLPDANRERVAELEGRLASFAHEGAWKEALGSDPDAPGLHDKVKLSDLWEKLQYKPEGEPDAKAIGELAGRARQDLDYLFRPKASGAGAADAANAAGAGAGASAGAPGGARGANASPTLPARPAGAGLARGSGDATQRPTVAAQIDERFAAVPGRSTDQPFRL
jgi:hypothetical protein